MDMRQFVRKIRGNRPGCLENSLGDRATRPMNVTPATAGVPAPFAAAKESGRHINADDHGVRDPRPCAEAM